MLTYLTAFTIQKKGTEEITLMLKCDVLPWRCQPTADTYIQHLY